MILYKRYYDNKYEFEGLGNIYQARRGAWEENRERRLFFDPANQPPLAETAHLPTYRIRFATNLADGAYFQIQLTMRFATSDGIVEARKKSQRIDHALYLAFAAYTKSEFEGEGNQDRAMVLVDRIIDKYIRSEVRHIYLTEYVLTEARKG